MLDTQAERYFAQHDRKRQSINKGVETRKVRRAELARLMNATWQERANWTEEQRQRWHGENARLQRIHNRKFCKRFPHLCQ